MDKNEKNEKILVLVAQILIAIVCILAILVTLVPKPNQTKSIELKKIDGKYVANGIVGINCNTISPYNFGSTSFVLENNAGTDKNCKISIKQVYDDIIVDDFQMQYKIYSESLPKTENWLLPNELMFENILLKNSAKQKFFVDWWWTGDESGNVDSYYGKEGGHFWLIVSIEEM